MKLVEDINCGNQLHIYIVVVGKYMHNYFYIHRNPQLYLVYQSISGKIHKHIKHICMHVYVCMCACVMDIPYLCSERVDKSTAGTWPHKPTWKFPPPGSPCCHVTL